MEKRKWYFKSGTNYEEYNILYDDGTHILVQNDNTKKYSFGMTQDFGTLFGFPVNWSCLTKIECIDTLKFCIEIDNKYGNPNKTLEVYDKMISALEEV